MPETIMTKNSPKFMSDPKSQIQEVQRTPNRINATKPLQLDISFSNYGKSKIEKKVLKVVRGDCSVSALIPPSLHCSLQEHCFLCASGTLPPQGFAQCSGTHSFRSSPDSPSESTPCFYPNITCQRASLTDPLPNTYPHPGFYSSIILGVMDELHQWLLLLLPISPHPPLYLCLPMMTNFQKAQIICAESLEPGYSRGSLIICDSVRSWPWNF